MGPIRKALLHPAAAALVLVLFYVLMMAAVRDKSATGDEPVYASAGTSYWRFNDYRLNPENGNLPQRWAALPLLGERFPDRAGPEWRTAHELAVSTLWLNRLGNPIEAMLWRGRAMCALLAVALGAVVWWGARELYGPGPALGALLLCVLNPNVLANGPLMTADICCTLFFALSAFAWWRVLERVTAGRLVLSCLAAAALFVSKMSAPLIVPVAAVLAILRIVQGEPLALGASRTRLIAGRARLAVACLGGMMLHAAAVVTVIWASFGFRYSALNPSDPHGGRLATSWAELTASESPAVRLVEQCAQHHLLPEGYLYGLLFIRKGAASRSAFLNGHWTADGWVGFFPYAWLVKTPLEEIAVAGIALWAVFAGWAGWRETWRAGYRAAPWWVLLVSYSAVALASHLNIGLRHLLPIFPSLFVLSSAAWTWNRPAVRWLLAGLTAALAVEMAAWFPDYLAYFNVLGGGRVGGYHHLADSSLDWGQDLPGAARYIREHPGEAPFYLSYFGGTEPDRYGIPAHMLHPMPAPLIFVQFPIAGGGAALQAQLAQHPGYEFVGSGQAAGIETAMLLQSPEALTLHPGTYLISATDLQWGPWDPRAEARYQQLRREMEPLFQPDHAAREEALQTQPATTWRDDLIQFNLFRIARLLSYLQARPRPETSIGGSILVFPVDTEALRIATSGPPPPMTPDERLEPTSKSAMP